MSEGGHYARLYDACEASGWHLEIAGGHDRPMVLEVHKHPAASLGAPRSRPYYFFQIPRGRTIEHAAAAVLHQLRDVLGQT